MKRIFSVIVAWCVLVYTLGIVKDSVKAQGSTPCNETISISVAAAASQTIATATPGQSIYVCQYTITGDTLATTAAFTSGSTALAGVMRMCDECSISAGDGTGIVFQTPQGGALTLAAVTGAITGHIRIGRNP